MRRHRTNPTGEASLAPGPLSENRIWRQALFLAAIVVVSSAASLSGAIQKYPGLRERTDKYIIDRVGEDYFRKHFRYFGLMPYPNDMPTGGERIAWYYYTISVDDYRQDVRVAVWARWSGLQWRVESAENLPDCMSDSSKCMPFRTTRDEAIKVAQDAGVLNGAVRFAATIGFYGGDINAYVWRIWAQTADHRQVAIVSLSAPELLHRSQVHSTSTPVVFDSALHRD